MKLQTKSGDWKKWEAMTMDEKVDRIRQVCDHNTHRHDQERHYLEDEINKLSGDLKETRISAFQRIDSVEQRLIKLEEKVDHMDRVSNILTEAGDREMVKALKKIKKLQKFQRRIKCLEMRK